MIRSLGTIAATAVALVGMATPVLAATDSVAGSATTTASAPAVPGLVGVSEHSNVLELGSSQAVSFTWDGGYSITEGQPWGGVTTGSGGQGGNGISITVEAGREGSAGPAAWFSQRTASPIADDEGVENFPEELNFALTGTLTINGTGYPIVIGQGHSGYNNNWWIGGQGEGWKGGVYGTSMLTDVMYTTTPDGKYAIAAETAMMNQFGIADASLFNGG